jgi:hypothetical protein
LLQRALVIMLPLPLRRCDQLYQSDFNCSYCLHPYVEGSAFGFCTLGATYVYRFSCGLITRTYPCGKVVGRLQHLGLPSCCYPTTGFRLFPWWDWLPLNTPAFTGRTTQRTSFHVLRSGISEGWLYQPGC